MYTPLQSIQAKLDRARMHISDFRKAVVAFHAMKPNPYEIKIREDRATQRRIWYLARVETVPINIPAIAADALQNLKATLDHITYQSELRGNRNIEPSHRVYFPIAKDATHYPALRAQFLKHSVPAVINEMDDIEPYSDGKGHGLWELNCLNNSDKHKLLVAAGSFFDGVELATDWNEMMKRLGPANRRPDVDFNKLMPPAFLRPANKLLSLKVGDELFNEPMTNKLMPDRKFRFDISFNHPAVLECESAETTLSRLAGLVDSVLNRFGPLLA